MNKDLNELLVAMGNSKLFIPVTIEYYEGIYFYPKYYVYLNYKNLYIFVFPKEILSGALTIADLPSTQINGAHKSGIGLATLFEEAPDDLKEFIIFNFDLFRNIKISRETRK